jgi:hypothetical protein
LNIIFEIGNRAQSEDRFGSSTLSLNNAAGDTTSSSSSHSHLPSYAAHTSSSMSKLREGTTTVTSSTPPPAVSIPASSSSSTTSLMMNSQTRRVTSVVSLDNRSKNMTKSRSTQNLVLPLTTIQQSKPTTLRRVKISRISRRPPNLPTATNNQSSTSSSTSSNTSSPTKINQTKENDQTKKYIHPTSSSSLQESVLPLRQLDNTTNDLMPKWAQDCFYRTVVLGLKPLLLKDIQSSPNKTPKRTSSTCSIESSDSLETASELQACTLNDNNQKEIKVRRSISIPDYRQIKQGLKILPPSLSERTINDTKEE